MATATEISTRALRRARVYDSNQSPSAIDIADATEALNAMIASWEAEGLSGDVLPLDSRFEQGVVAMLAVRICEEYGKTPGPILMRDAQTGWMALQAAFTFVPKSRFDTVLTNNRYIGTLEQLDSNDLDDYEDWQASTAYALRFYVINNSNVYECTTAGTSAASGGPSGTDAAITDGTVTWTFRSIHRA
jgi:hypothetical protein